MIKWVHPALFFFLGGLLLPFFKGKAKQAVILLIPAGAIMAVALTSAGQYGQYHFLNITGLFGRVDRLSLVFAWVFVIMAFLGALYGLRRAETGHHIAGCFYVGSALGVVFAGDYLTLFILWEIMAFASVFLVWYHKEPESLAAGFRYLLFHIFGGVLLLAGIMLHYAQTGSLAFDSFLPANAAWPEYLILAGFGLNAAILPLHAWLPDAYPAATVEGAVFLCAFTTKTAVYVLARGFAGFEALTIFGAAMAVFGVCYALVENDMRRALAYDIISKVGYMVAAVGIGTPAAINGVAALAFAHILYKALFFMSAGAVLAVTGETRLTRLGGLSESMPVTMLFYLVGVLSIAGFPLFSGFVSKSLIIEAAHEQGRFWLLSFLNLAGIGTFLAVGLRVPYFVFFGKAAPLTAKEPPRNMLGAMGLTALLCFLIGGFPGMFYRLLPFPETYQPYNWPHFSETFQLLAVTGLVFFSMRKYLAPQAIRTRDVDYLYRKGAQFFLKFAENVLSPIDALWGEVYRKLGLKALFETAAGFSRFDRAVIDGIVDDTARSVVEVGGLVKKLQTGQIQAYLGLSLCLFFGMLWLVLIAAYLLQYVK